ncbi:MAG: hypothetical protein ACLTE2_07245 [Eubacteriales bacterium]
MVKKKKKKIDKRTWMIRIVAMGFAHLVDVSYRYYCRSFSPFNK